MTERPMARRLPNLNQLRAFEAAVRCGSFKAGADDLNVTQAAISHQVKALEERLGVELFRRGPREAVPTERARDFADALGGAFDTIAAATDAISAAPCGPLRLSVAPFHGNRWLVPALRAFMAEHPDIAVEASLSFDIVDLADGHYDAAPRFGDGAWPDLDAQPVHDDRLRPVATRALVGDCELPMTPEAIARLPLLTDAAHQGNWPMWFAEAGYTGAVPNQVIYEARAYVVDAVMSGHGAHLLDVRLTERNVADGQLVYLSDIEVVSDMAYWMVRPVSRPRDPRLDLLTRWLAERARQPMDSPARLG